jgi:hypothetical protein
MDALWALVVVIRPCHITLALTLVDHEDDLSSYLRAKESRLIISVLLPLGKVLGRFDYFDVGRRLAVSRVGALSHAGHERVPAMLGEML